MISQSRTPAGILRTLTAILCLAAILMSVTGSSAWAAPRVVRVVGIQDGISDSQADYFRRTIAELNDLTEDRIFVTRPIPAASSLDLNAYQGLDFAIVSPRVFALLERYNGFIPMASLSVDIPDCEPGAELRPVVSALVFATPDADEDGLAKPHLSDIAGETVTVVKGDEVDTTFLLQNELSSRRLAPVKVRVASDGGTPSEIIRRAVECGDKLFAVSTDLLRETSSDLFSGFVKVDMRVDDETGLVSSVTPMPGRVFAAGLSVARMGLLEFAATLFALDIAPDIHWVRPADYRSVHLAAERMRDPVYMSYQKKTLLEEMREHAAWVILAAAILIGMIWHSVAAERLVRRRSAELMETVKRQQASERQFEALERMTAVSQMSNIVAHELRQPLAAVTNFAMGVRRRIANGTLTADSLEFALGRILAENERASDIVEHVRDYARKRRRQITPVDLTQMSAKVVSSMRASNARVSFESEVPAGLFVEGDSLEIELVLRNLVKNAGESAAQADGVPRVVLAGERIGDEVVITVTDNGPVRTKAEIDAFLVPLRSEKSGGLGLGLAIVRRIIEAYGGTIPRGGRPDGAGLRRLRRPHDGHHGHGAAPEAHRARKPPARHLRERPRRHRDGRQGDEARRGGLPHEARRRREAPLLDRPRRRKKLRGSGRGRNGPRTCGPLAGAQSPRVPGRAARRRGPHHEGRLRRTRHRRAHRTGPRRPRLLEARR